MASEPSSAPEQADDELLELVRSLAKNMNAKVAFVCELVDSDTARTVALHVDGHFLDNLEYKVAGTPCQRVYKEGSLFHPREVSQIYPEDRMLADLDLQAYAGVAFYDSRGVIMGHLGIMNGGVMSEDQKPQVKLREAAIKVGAAMERRRRRERR